MTKAKGRKAPVSQEKKYPPSTEFKKKAHIKFSFFYIKVSQLENIHMMSTINILQKKKSNPQI